jgi:toxin ParE1/3/4
MKLEFHAQALAELHSAARYYESRQPGLGARFLDVVDEALERIARDPLAWSPGDEDVRRCLTRIFPFGIFYTIEPEFILILAVAHLSREPAYWTSRRAR